MVLQVVCIQPQGTRSQILTKQASPDGKPTTKGPKELLVELRYECLGLGYLVLVLVLQVSTSLLGTWTRKV